MVVCGGLLWCLVRNALHCTQFTDVLTAVAVAVAVAAVAVINRSI